MPELPEATVRYEQGDGGAAVVITIGRANGYMGMKRSMMTYQAVEENRKKDETDPVAAVLRTMTYPDLIAATKQVEGIPWPISFDEFIALPDDLIAAWEEAVYKLNPHWNPPVEPDAKKD